MSANDRNDRTDAMPQLPPNFFEWPLSDRINWMALNEHRRGLITKLMLEARISTDQELEREHYLTEKDLAAIYCRILELKNER